MNADEALRGLASGASNERLQAARALAKLAEPRHREQLVAALARETVVWIRSALSDALIRASGGQPTGPIETAAVDLLPAEDVAYARGLEHATRSILHEINPILGMLRVSAAEEIQEYRSSRSKRQIERLMNLLRGLRELNEAATEVHIAPMNLSETLRLVAEATSEVMEHHINLAGPDTLIVSGNADLVDLIITNALRNAVEAQRAASVSDPVLINWDTTDTEVWIAVLDRGIGLPPGSEHAFEFGRSTKASHPGLGLSIARRAAESLGGKVALSPRVGGGVNFELRWPIPMEE